MPKRIIIETLTYCNQTSYKLQLTISNLKEKSDNTMKIENRNFLLCYAFLFFFTNLFER